LFVREQVFSQRWISLQNHTQLKKKLFQRFFWSTLTPLKFFYELVISQMLYKVHVNLTLKSFQKWLKFQYLKWPQVHDDLPYNSNQTPSKLKFMTKNSPSEIVVIVPRFWKPHSQKLIARLSKSSSLFNF
jgi:hypothetical protein